MSFLRDNKGLEMVEWGMVAAGVAVVGYVAYKVLGADISAFISGLGGMF